MENTKEDNTVAIVSYITLICTLRKEQNGIGCLSFAAIPRIVSYRNDIVVDSYSRMDIECTGIPLLDYRAYLCYSIRKEDSADCRRVLSKHIERNCLKQNPKFIQ
jgi:hypothetical protein